LSFRRAPILERATRLLEKSERACLITTPLNAAVTLVPTIEVG
jgi:hypothetical protein